MNPAIGTEQKLDQKTTQKTQSKFAKFFSKDNLFNEAGIGLIIVLVLIGVLVVILVNPAGFKSLTNKLALVPASPTPTNAPTAIPTPTPTPRPIAKGPQEYTVMGSTDPKIKGFKISEFDPKMGQSQTMTVSVVDTGNVPITKVEVKLITDHRTHVYPLSLVSGSKTDGEWAANWTIDDSHDYIYSAVYSAKNEKGESSNVTGSFR